MYLLLPFTINKAYGSSYFPLHIINLLFKKLQSTLKFQSKPFPWYTQSTILYSFGHVLWLIYITDLQEENHVTAILAEVEKLLVDEALTVVAGNKLVSIKYILSIICILLTKVINSLTVWSRE